MMFNHESTNLIQSEWFGMLKINNIKRKVKNSYLTEEFICWQNWIYNVIYLIHKIQKDNDTNIFRQMRLL